MYNTGSPLYYHLPSELFGLIQQSKKATIRFCTMVMLYYI